VQWGHGWRPHARTDSAWSASVGGFCHLFKNCRGPQPFTSSQPFWMTFHWLRFRAQGPTATLSLSDWAKPGELGGPTGQQVIVNFVEVQPVFDPVAVN